MGPSPRQQAIGGASSWTSTATTSTSVIVNELEPATGNGSDSNATINQAQGLGELATSINTGDDTLRLGFEVHGAISYDDPSDADTYSFQGTAGTEVWLAVERTSFSLDSVMELLDADGNVVARSDNFQQENADTKQLLAAGDGAALPFQADPWTPTDDYSTNPYDPAMRVVLPGPAGTVETYYVRIYSALNIGDIDAANLPAGITGINAPVGISGILTSTSVSSTNLAKLSGQTFQITDGNNVTATFELIDTAGTTTLTAGDVPIYYDSSTDTIAIVRTDMVQAINGYIVMGNLDTANLPVVIDNINATKVPTIADLDGTQFQIKVGSSAAVTFEFVNTSVRNQASNGAVAVFFNSTTDTIDTVRADMVNAINGADFGCTAQALADGNIALYGNEITFKGAVSGEIPTPFTQATTSIASLDGATFQITDGNGKAVTFEFIDSAGSTTLTTGDVAVTFNSTSDGIDNVRTDMVNAINGVGFGCTAQLQPDGTIALFGTGVTLETGNTPFSEYSSQFPNQPPSVKLDLTAQALPDGTIALQGPGSSPQGPSVTLTLPSGSSFAAENNLENLDGTTFQLTDADNNTTTFEFVNVANPGRVVTTGDVGVYFQWTRSTRRTTPSIRSTRKSSTRSTAIR